MAKKIQKKNNEEGIKSKTLFDHINAITKGTDPDYWLKLSESDKKTWSTYLVNKFLSMNMDWIEIISELEPYTTGNQLPPKLVFKLYFDLIPKSNIYLKYVKGRLDKKFQKPLIEIIQSHFEISSKQAKEYLELYYNSNEGIDEVKNILKMYAYDDKEIKKLIKIK